MPSVRSFGVCWKSRLWKEFCLDLEIWNPFLAFWVILYVSLLAALALAKCLNDLFLASQARPLFGIQASKHEGYLGEHDESVSKASTYLLSCLLRFSDDFCMGKQLF